MISERSLKTYKHFIKGTLILHSITKVQIRCRFRCICRKGDERVRPNMSHIYVFLLILNEDV